MKPFLSSLCLFLSFVASASASVTVTSPASGSTVSSPVHFAATAVADGCSTGVASMGIYVNGTKTYVLSGASLDTTLSLNPGIYQITVEEWDRCKGASTAHLSLTVGGGPATPASVTVTSPAANSTVSSPVTFQATATAGSCTAGVASMGVYINGTKAYVSNGASLSYTATLSPGTYQATVEEWDRCKGATTAHLPFTVAGAPTGPAGVTVTSPAANAALTSPVSFQATASAGSCTAGVASMGIYVNGSKTYVVNGASLNTSLALNPGSYQITVEEWDRCKGATTAHIPITVTAPSVPTVSISANPTTVAAGSSATLTVQATDSTQVTVSGDGHSWTLPASGGTLTVTPSQTTTYTAEASSAQDHASATTTVTVVSAGSVNSINHVVFLLQENHSFDNYFGMLNPYRKTHGWNMGDDGHEYDVDGIDDKLSKISNPDDEGDNIPLFKLASTCVDDMSSAWLESFGDVSRWNFTTARAIKMDGFVHTAEGFSTRCNSGDVCSGKFTDLTGRRAMGYYDQDFLNYYYYMASQFAVSDRWFSPLASKSVPNRIATFTGGTTQGLVKDPGSNDHLPQLSINNIFQELDQAKVSWKVYYTVTEGLCTDVDDCLNSGDSVYPANHFSNLSYSFHYIYNNPSGAPCVAPTQPSSVVGDTSNSYCIDPSHIAPISTYYTDLANGTLPSFAFIEAGYGHNDEHPGSGQTVLNGQQQVSSILNAFMTSSAWNDSVFFLSYDEGGGPYDHVPPVPGHSNDNTAAALGTIPDIASVSVNPDSNPAYFPCVPSGGSPTTHCDLKTTEPGAHPNDVAALQGFGAQLGFRVPNMVVSRFTRRHYVSHIPMDHTAVIRFVENRFIGSSAHLTNRDAAQPNLLDFFDFSSVPWATPPTPPAPVTAGSLGYNSCTPGTMGP